jgi:transposase
MAIHVAVLMAMQRVEVITDGGRRRRYDEREKLRLFRGAFSAGVRVAEFAHIEGVDASLLYRWRRQLLGAAAERASFAPLVVADDEPVEAGRPSASSPPPDPAPGILEVELACAAGPDHRGGRPGRDPGGRGGAARAPAMIALPAGARVWLANGVTDMRKGMPGLSLLIQEGLGRHPYAGASHVLCGHSGSLVEILWHDGVGMSPYAKRLEPGRFAWPAARDGTVAISAAQTGRPLDGTDWRDPRHTWRPASCRRHACGVTAGRSPPGAGPVVSMSPKALPGRAELGR